MVMERKASKKIHQDPLMSARHYILVVSGALLLLIFAAIHEYWILFYNAYGCELLTKPQPGAGIIAEEHCAPLRSPYFQFLFKGIAIATIIGTLVTGALQRWKEAFIVAGTLLFFATIDFIQILVVSALQS